MKWLFTASALFTYSQLIDVQCKSYCQFAAGYDSGLYVEASNQCWCADRIKMEKLAEKKLLFPSKPSKIKSTPSVPYKSSNSEDYD